MNYEILYTLIISKKLKKSCRCIITGCNNELDAVANCFFMMGKSKGNIENVEVKEWTGLIGDEALEFLKYTLKMTDYDGNCKCKNPVYSRTLTSDFEHQICGKCSKKIK